MKEIIIEYITSTFSASSFGVFTDGRLIYYDVLSSHLHKMFRLTEYEIDCYLISWLHVINQELDFVHYKNIMKPEIYNIVIENDIDFEDIAIEYIEIDLVISPSGIIVK